MTQIGKRKRSRIPAAAPDPRLRALPSVDAVLRTAVAARATARYGRPALVVAVR